MKGYTVETFVRVYDDGSGWFYEVRPDTDGCDGVEIRYSDGDGGELKCVAIMPRDAAKLLGQALLDVAADIDARLAAEQP